MAPLLPEQVLLSFSAGCIILVFPPFFANPFPQAAQADCVEIQPDTVQSGPLSTNPSAKPFSLDYFDAASVFLLQLSASGSKIKLDSFMKAMSKTSVKANMLNKTSHCSQTVLPVPS